MVKVLIMADFGDLTFVGGDVLDAPPMQKARGKPRAFCNPK